MIVKGVAICMLIHKRLWKKDKHSLQGKQHNKLTSYMYFMKCNTADNIHAQDTLGTYYVHMM